MKIIDTHNIQLSLLKNFYTNIKIIKYKRDKKKNKNKNKKDGLTCFFFL